MLSQVRRENPKTVIQRRSTAPQDQPLVHLRSAARLKRFAESFSRRNVVLDRRALQQISCIEVRLEPTQRVLSHTKMGVVGKKASKVAVVTLLALRAGLAEPRGVLGERGRNHGRWNDVREGRRRRAHCKVDEE